jgi:hypothetical protein
MSNINKMLNDLNLESMQRAYEERMEMPTKKLKKNKWYNKVKQPATKDPCNYYVDGKVLLRIKRKKRGTFHGAVGSEAMEVYKNGNY